MHIACPKCRSKVTRIEIVDDREAVHTCYCGYRKVMYTTLEDGIQIDHLDVGGDVGLPTRGTRQIACLDAVQALWKASTREVRDWLVKNIGGSWTLNEVGTFLLYLRYRGLVDATKIRLGRLSLCEWEITQKSKDLLGVAPYGPSHRTRYGRKSPHR